MKKTAYILLVFVLMGCGGEQKEGMKISANEIDQYVEEKTGEDQEYDVSQSLRFSNDSESYEVVRYMQNDSVVLFLETEANEEGSVVRNTFFKEGQPVYIEEYIAENKVDNPYTQRKVYLDGANVKEAFKRSSNSESDLELLDYESASVDWDEFDFDKPVRAMEQKGEFKMKFGEFIELDPQMYLVLENEESEFDVALFVTDLNHPVLNQLYSNQESFKGQPVFVTHQFVLMNGIERMLFVDARLD